jgi:hypothetical protein
LLFAVPAFLVAEHMGGLAQGAAQALQLRGEAGWLIGGWIEVGQEGVEACQAQAGLEPGELPKLPGDHFRTLIIAEVAGQMAHQVGAGVGAVGLYFGEGPGVDLFRALFAVNRETSCTAVAPII